MVLKKRYSKENDNVHTNNDNNHSGKHQQQKNEQPRAIKIAEELQKKERESEQIVVDPHEVLEEEEKVQPQSQQE
jgi:hypothetical protein